MIYQEEEIRAEIEKQKDKAALMIEANKARSERQDVANSFKGPIYVAIIGAIIAFLLEFLGSAISSKNDRELERFKAQAALVESAIGATVDETRRNLEFLVATNLVTNEIVDTEKLHNALLTDAAVPVRTVQSLKGGSGGALLPGDSLVLLGSDTSLAAAKETVSSHYSDRPIILIKNRGVYRIAQPANSTSEAAEIIAGLPEAVLKWGPYTVRRSSWCPVSLPSEEDPDLIECVTEQ